MHLLLQRLEAAGVNLLTLIWRNFWNPHIQNYKNLIKKPPDLNDPGGLYHLAEGLNIPKNKNSRDF